MATCHDVDNVSIFLDDERMNSQTRYDGISCPGVNIKLAQLMAE